MQYKYNILNNTFNNRIITIFIGFLGVGIYLLNIWNYGNGITDDSVNYIYAGKNLIDLEGLFNYNGNIYTNWPPLYPFLIFLSTLVSNDIYLNIVILNSFLYFSTIYLSGEIASLYLKSFLYRIAFPIVLSLSYPMLFAFTKVWTEPIYITLSFCIFLLEKKNSNIYILLLFISTAILTRYIGVTILAAYFLYRLTKDTESDIATSKKLTLKHFLLLISSVFPLLLWFIRNLLLSQGITTLSFNTQFNIAQNFYRLFDSISILFVPQSANNIIRGLLVISFWGISILIIRMKSFKFVEFGFIKYYVFFYITFQITLSSTFKFEDISLRYAIPLYPFVLLFLFRYFEHLNRKFDRFKIKTSLFIVFFIICVFPIEKGLKHSVLNYKNGINDFSAKKWKKSETIQYINSNLKNSTIYSNSPAGIFINTSVKSFDICDINNRNVNINGIVIVLFNENLPGIAGNDSLENIFSQKDSVLYFSDSKIFINKE